MVGVLLDGTHLVFAKTRKCLHGIHDLALGQAQGILLHAPNAHWVGGLGHGNARGVLLGQFTDCTPADEKPSLDLATVLADYLRPLGVPMLAGFPSGHVRNNLALPLGTRVQLNADRQTLAILEPPVAK